MRDKVVLGVTLAIVLLLTLVIYGVVDTQRIPSLSASDLDRKIEKGQTIYAQYCIQCHGPKGEGCIGPALNRVAWHPVLESGDANPAYDDGSYDFIKKTVERGRASNQPGIQMPAWSTKEGQALNDQEIDDVVTFVQRGDFNKTLESAPSATGLNEPLNPYPGFSDTAQLARVKEIMLAKGCLNCHALGKGGGKIGAVLDDVGSRRSAEWLKKWISNPPAVPAAERGPNLWLVAPTVTVPVSGIPTAASAAPTATVQRYPMNTTYMPKIAMTEEELNLLVDYLSKARTTK